MKAPPYPSRQRVAYVENNKQLLKQYIENFHRLKFPPKLESFNLNLKENPQKKNVKERYRERTAGEVKRE